MICECCGRNYRGEIPESRQRKIAKLANAVRRLPYDSLARKDIWEIQKSLGIIEKDRILLN